MSHTEDNHYMSIALRLAKLNQGCTAPNPSVGCVIVKNNCIIGQGHTALSGRPHAEQIALDSCRTSSKGATAYVTLEPCSFVGKTPSCAMLLKKAGIKHVVIASRDPHPKVSGKGIQILQQHNITVTESILKDQAAELYAGLFSSHLRKRPWITIKLATTLDGMSALSNKTSQWITGTKARQWGHYLRKTHDAILTGIHTVQHDNPELTCRIPGLKHKSPTRIICDTNLEIDPSSNIVQTSKQTPTIIATCSTDKTNIESLSKLGVIVWQLPKKNSHIDLHQLFTKLHQEGFLRILVEAGPTLTTECIKASFVDDIIWFHSNKIFGSDATPSVLPLDLSSIEASELYTTYSVNQLDNDSMTHLRHNNSKTFIEDILAYKNN